MMNEALREKFNYLSCMIGRTPLLEVKFTYKGEERLLYVKAEHYNLTGSIKDRMALYIMRRAYEEERVTPGARIIEATSGNTGIAFAAVGRALGHPVTIFMPDWLSSERINLIKSFGADIELVSKEAGGFLGSIDQAEQLARDLDNSFLPRQFSNPDNPQAHFLTTGPEIWMQLANQNKTPDAFIAGVGTGGTIMGVGNYLRERQPDIQVHPLEPSNSPTMSTGHKVGRHRIQGISDDFIPEIVKLNELESIVDIDDGDAIIMAQKFAAQLGLGVGISSGANFLGALKIQNEMGGRRIIVTVFPDDNKKYLSTDLMKQEPLKDDFLAPDVELISYKGRRCIFCHKDPVQAGIAKSCCHVV